MTTFDHISSSIESRIANGFARINTALRSKAWAQAATNGLTPTQADILNLLASRTTALRLTTIAEYLAITPATASDAVAALVSKGFVEKARAADDGRAIALKLTKTGVRMAASTADWGSFLHVALETLDEAEKTAMLKLIIKIIRQLQERGEIPINRMCVTCRYFGANEYADPRTPHYCHLVKAPIGVPHLRLDCPEHEEADKDMQLKNWVGFNRP